MILISSRGRESGFPCAYSEGYRTRRINAAISNAKHTSHRWCWIDAYSAAATDVATNDGFRFAADNMKSEMRGTISDLKREPLKTP